MGAARRGWGVFGSGGAGGGARVALEVELLTTWDAGGGGGGDTMGTGAGALAAHQTPAAINTAVVPADRPTVTNE